MNELAVNKLSSSNQLRQINASIRGCDVAIAANGNGYVELDFGNDDYDYLIPYSVEGYGRKLSARAVANEGAEFINWTKSGEEVSTRPYYELYDTSYNLVANFSGTSEIATHTVTFNPNGEPLCGWEEDVTFYAV